MESNFSHDSMTPEGNGGTTFSIVSLSVAIDYISLRCLLVRFRDLYPDFLDTVGNLVVTTATGRGFPVVDFICLNEQAAIISTILEYFKNEDWSGGNYFAMSVPCHLLLEKNHEPVNVSDQDLLT
ncbi:unnamed protein product [Phytophthora fragariaefolia]|uniref:Unnamed protein product n=1 Tax=Phytophthora fragariaefolia TaxID=1490495 RepID=A0A9W6Y453_9STRA|nr:unnamed protein product [Phytophthora fragariaefolia]